MSRKYVGQVNNQNFVYPNQNLVEYDVEIVHDINDNCVLGTITSFSATTVSSTGITFTHNRTFNLNGATPFTTFFYNPLYVVNYLSVHCQVPNQPYMNTWRLVDIDSTSTVTPNTLVITGGTNTFTIVPSQFGLTSFSNGVYSFEFRFIGQNCLYKICSSLNINVTTPTPTPSPTPTSTPTPTPTATSVPGSPVDFSISNTCVGQIGYLTISGGTGGSGTYQFNQYYYSSAAAASGTTTGYTVSTGATWSNIPDGTWYFVMRDNTNNSNKIVKSAVVNCDSNPPSCVTGVTFNVTGVPIEMFYQDCEGVVQSVIYTTLGSKTIADCLQVNSLNSPDFTYNSVVYAGTVCNPVTPTPTPSPTPTSTPVCSCYFHNAIIGQADLNIATGNTLTFRNNKVYTGYFDCNGNEAFKAYDTAGTYTNDLCPNGIPVNVYYWRDNVATVASASSVVNTGVCCTVPTPTPTATNTPTPTPTPSPTPTNTPAPIDNCYCYPIVVTGTTIPGPEGGTIATLEYNDCFGTLTVRSFTVGPGTYYQCIQTDDTGVPQYNPLGTTGIDQSYINLTYMTGNCNTGYVCTGYVPAATPTPTPTAAPPTPTPTPTGAPITATPTPSPTPTATPVEGNCWCIIYSTIPGDLYVRYRDLEGSVQTTLISNIDTMDNGDGTYTGCICVYPTGAYSTPVCVQGGIEVTCDPYIWTQGGTCTTAGPCFLG